MRKCILPALCLGAVCLTLSGCAGSGEPFTEQHYTPEEEIREIQLDVRGRTIEVAVSEDGQVHLQYAENSKESYDIAVSDGVLTVTSVSDKDWTDYIGGSPAAEDRRMVLELPAEGLETLILSTTNEDMALPDLTVSGSVSLSNNGGDITFGTLDAGSGLTFWVKNGDLTGTVAGSEDDYTITAEVKKGECSLPAAQEGGGKPLQVSGNNGDIAIAFAGD